MFIAAMHLLALFIGSFQIFMGTCFDGSSPPKHTINAPQLRATVMSNNLTRYNRTHAILLRHRFRVELMEPIDYQSVRIDRWATDNNISLPNDARMRKTLSNRLTFHDMITNFAREPGHVSNSTDWMFFFEDDINDHPGVHVHRAIVQGMHISAVDGILYLGICSPRCELGSNHTIQGVEYSRCHGNCAHAFGVAKWKCSRIIPLFLILQKEYSTGTHMLYFDQGLHKYGEKVNPIFVVGTNLASPVDARHFGLFYQDRGIFHSQIDNDH